MTWPSFLLGLCGTAVALAGMVIMAAGDLWGLAAVVGGVLLLYEADSAQRR